MTAELERDLKELPELGQIPLILIHFGDILHFPFERDTVSLSLSLYKTGY